MRDGKLLDCKAIGELSWVPNFQTIAEQHYLYTAIACVVSVADGINNSFFDGIRWQFKICGHGSGIPFRTCTYSKIYPVHHECCGLIYHLK